MPEAAMIKPSSKL